MQIVKNYKIYSWTYKIIGRPFTFENWKAEDWKHGFTVTYWSFVLDQGWKKGHPHILQPVWTKLT